MKKILILLVIILLAFFGYQVYLRNAPKKEEEKPYVFDDNYVLSVSFDDNLVSKLIKKTYYIYNNERAVLKVETSDRGTKEHLDTTYTELKITDKNFNLDDIIYKLDYAETAEIASVYRYVYYVKKSDKIYRLSRGNDINKEILTLFGEETTEE